MDFVNLVGEPPYDAELCLQALLVWCGERAATSSESSTDNVTCFRDVVEREHFNAERIDEALESSGGDYEQRGASSTRDQSTCGGALHVGSVVDVRETDSAAEQPWHFRGGNPSARATGMKSTCMPLQRRTRTSWSGWKHSRKRCWQSRWKQMGHRRITLRGSSVSSKWRLVCCAFCPQLRKTGFWCSAMDSSGGGRWHWTLVSASKKWRIACDMYLRWSPRIGNAPCKFQAVAGDTGEDCRGKEVMRRNHGTDRSARVPIPS